MLRQLSKRHKMILWFFVILVVPAFGLIWGTGGINKAVKGPADAGKLFGRKVGWDDFKAAYKKLLVEYRMRYGDSFDQIMRRPGLEEQLIDEAWKRLVLDHEIRVRKLKVTDEELASEIRDNPAFQRDGRFDTRLYSERVQAIASKAGLSAAGYEQLLRGQLEVNKLFKTVSQDVTAGDGEIMKEFKAQNDKAVLSYCLVESSAFADAVVLSDDEIQKYYDEHKDGFRKEEALKLKYAAIVFEDLAKDMEATDEEIQAYYEQHKEEFKAAVPPPAEADAQSDTPLAQEEQAAYKPLADARDEILKKVADQKARDLARRKRDAVYEIFLQKEPSLEEISEIAGVGLQVTDYFSENEPIPGLGFMPQLSKTAFELPKNQVSDCIETQKGYYYIRREGEPRPASIMSLDEAKERIDAALKADKAGEAAREKAEGLLGQIKQKLGEPGTTFSSVVETLGYKAGKSEPVTQLDFIPEIGPIRELADVFSAEPGKILGPVKTHAGYALLQLDQVIPADEEKFQDEKEKYREMVLRRKEYESRNEWLDTLIKSAGIESNVTVEDIRRY